MREFEPKLKKKVFTNEFFSKYVYVFAVGLCLLLGVSYGLTFFVQNKSITTGSITTGDLTVNFSDRSINVSGLLPPQNDQEGMLLYAKNLTINNTSNIDGKLKLSLTRTSGLDLTDLRYVVIVNGSIQTIADVTTNGILYETALMGNESMDVQIRIWPKVSYSGNATSFVGEITPEIKYFGSKAASISSPAGKYVNFNCNGSNCEIWQIVKVEDGRLVLTRQADYSGATARVGTGKYYSNLSFNDDSLISSVSDDNDHKNVYLLRTVKIADGTGTLQDPFVLTNNILSEPDKKVIATITYRKKIIQSSGTSYENVGTQKIYDSEITFISQVLDNEYFTNWTDGTNNYSLGDMVNFNTDKVLTAEIEPPAAAISFDNTITRFDCDNVQCAILALYNAKQ